MKNKNKLLILFITVFVLFTVLDVAMALAADIRDVTLNVPIGDLTKLDEPIVGPCSNNPDNDCTKIPWIAQYIGAIYFYGLRIGAMFSVLMIIVGGVVYLTAGVNPGSVSKAKGYILSSLFGMVILFGSYLILYQINPDLTKLPSIEVEQVKRIEIVTGDSKFCERLDQTMFTIKGYDPATAKCGDGKTYEIEYNKAVERGVQMNLTQKTCISSKCDNPTDACDQFDGTYQCVFAYVYGDIIEYPEAYVDYVRLKANRIGAEDTQMGLARFYSEKTNYSIGQNDVLPNWVGSDEFNAQTYYLSIESNTPAFGPSWDHSYSIDRYGNPIGIDGSICCKYSCGGDGRLVITEGCDLINRNELVGTDKTAISIDVDTRKLFCGDKPIADMVDKDGHSYEDDECYVTKGSIPIGNVCTGNDSECIKGSCVASEQVSDQEIITYRCSCNSTADCPFGKICVDTGNWGVCSTTDKVPSGTACGDRGDDGCISGDCYDATGICECSPNDGSCPEGMLCKENSGMQNTCVPGKTITQACDDDWECLSDSCQKGTCGCDDDEDCDDEQYCKIDETVGGRCLERRSYGAECDDADQCLTNLCNNPSRSQYFPEFMGKRVCGCRGDNDCPTGKKCEELALIGSLRLCK